MRNPLSLILGLMVAILATTIVIIVIVILGPTKLKTVYCGPKDDDLIFKTEIEDSRIFHVHAGDHAGIVTCVITNR